MLSRARLSIAGSRRYDIGQGSCIDQMLLLSLQRNRAKRGSLAEWLGTGLQNRLRRFESARNLRVELPKSSGEGLGSSLLSCTMQNAK